ncbi:MAG: site-2 protease family protein [Hyphomicrobiaceae bacterium]
MLGGSIPLLRIRSTLVQMHVTFPLLLAFVAYDGWLSGGQSGAVASVVFILLLFLCVVLHEFGHVEAARRYGIHTPTVTLTPIGGIAALERMPERPVQEIVVALAGPAVTLAIAVVLFLILGFAVDLDGLTRSEADAWHLVGRVAMANVVLLLFNLIPAFPMDGGRVLRGLLAIWLGRLRATTIAARIGQALALGFAVLGVLYSPMLLLVAAFVFLAAESEVRYARRPRPGRQVTAGAIAARTLRTLSADGTVAEITPTLDHTSQTAFPVANAEQRIVGSVRRERLAEAWMAGAHGASVGSLMHSGMAAIQADAPVSEAYHEVMSSDAPLTAVVDADGRLAGYLSKELLLSMKTRPHRERPTGPLISS